MQPCFGVVQVQASKVLVILGILLITVGLLASWLSDWNTNLLMAVPIGFFVLLIATVASLQ